MKVVLIFCLMLYVHKFLVSSSGIDSTSTVNENSFDLVFHTLYFLRSNTYYISFSDYSKYRAKVSTEVDKFYQLLHMHPIS